MSAQVKAGKDKVSDLVEKLRQGQGADGDQEGLESPDAQVANEGGDSANEEGQAESSEDVPVSEEEQAIDPREQVKVVDKAPCDKLDDLSEVDAEAANDELVRIVEGLIFASPHPLHVREAVSILEDYEPQAVQAAFKVLSLGREGSGLQLARSAQGYRWTTDPQHAKHVQRLVVAKPQRLSRPQLETLAVVAYRQPVTRPEIDHIRGVDSQATLKALVDRELIAVVGQTADPGRPRLYGTTLFFLEYLNITELESLPPLGELSDLSERTRELLRSKVGVEEAERLSAQVLALAKEQDDAALQEAASEGDSDEDGASKEGVRDAESDGEAASEEGAREAESEGEDEAGEAEAESEDEDAEQEEVGEAESDDEDDSDDDAVESESESEDEDAEQEEVSESDSDDEAAEQEVFGEAELDKEDGSEDEAGEGEAESDEDDDSEAEACEVESDQDDSTQEDESDEVCDELDSPKSAEEPSDSDEEDSSEPDDEAS